MFFYIKCEGFICMDILSIVNTVDALANDLVIFFGINKEDVEKPE